MGTRSIRENIFILVCLSAGCRGFTDTPHRRSGRRFQQAYYIEGTQLWKKGIFKKEENALRFDAWKGEFSRLEEEYYKLSEKGIYFITPLDEEYPRRLYSVYDYPLGLM